MANLSVNMRAIILVLLAFLCFNIADAFLNAVVDVYHFGSVAFYPLISYLIFLIIFSKPAGGLASLKNRKYVHLHIIRGFFNTIGFIGFIIAIEHITLAQTYTLVLTSPFWVAIASILILKKQIGWHRWLAIIIGFTGVIVVLNPNSDGLHISSIGALACAIGSAGSMLMAKIIGDNEPLINMIFYPLIVTIISIVSINIFWKGWEIIAFEHAFLFIAAGAVFLIADFLFVKGFASGDTDLLAPLHYSQIIWGALIGYFFFNEIPETQTYIGATIIIISGIYLIYREHKAHKALRK